MDKEYFEILAKHLQAKITENYVIEALTHRAQTLEFHNMLEKFTKGEEVPEEWKEILSDPIKQLTLFDEILQKQNELIARKNRIFSQDEVEKLDLAIENLSEPVNKIHEVECKNFSKGWKILVNEQMSQKKKH